MHKEQVKTIEAMEITRSFGICKAVYHNDCYLRLFGKI